MSRRNSNADGGRPFEDRPALSVTTPAVLRLQSAAASAGPRSRSSSISNPAPPTQDLSASISSLPEGAFSSARPTNLSSSFSSITSDSHPSHRQNPSTDGTGQIRATGPSRFSYHLPNAAPTASRPQPLTPSTTSVPPSAAGSPRSQHSDSASAARPPLQRPISAAAVRSQPSPSGSVGNGRVPSAAGFAVPQGRPVPTPSVRQPQQRQRRRSSSDSEEEDNSGSGSGSDNSDVDSSPDRRRRRRHSSSDHSSDEGSGSGTGSDHTPSEEEEDEDGSDTGSGSGETGTDATDSESDSSPQRQRLIVGRRPEQSAFQQTRPPINRAGTSAFTPTHPQQAPAFSRVSTTFSTPSQALRTGSAGPSPVNSSPFLSRSVTSLPPPLLRAGTFSMLSANKVMPPNEAAASGGVGGLLGTGLLNFVSGNPSIHQRSVSLHTPSLSASPSPSLAAIPELSRSVPELPAPPQAPESTAAAISGGPSATEAKSTKHNSHSSSTSGSKHKKKHGRRSRSSHHKSNGTAQPTAAAPSVDTVNTLAVPQTNGTPLAAASQQPVPAAAPKTEAAPKLSDEEKKEMYDIGKTIGRGRFSSVKLGRVKNTEQFLAIKVISKANLKPADQADLKKEIDALQAVSGHPHVVALKDTFEDAEKLYLVMELCEGGTLFERILKQGKFSERTAVTICRQIASALQHIHRCGVVHRDLKPENIMFLNKSVADEDIHIKIGDFGLSKIINADLLETMKTQCGTWAYCAPEVIESTPYTHKVDHWTLGVLMYILLGGYHPFDPWGNLEKHELMEKIQAVQYNFSDPVWNDVSGKAKFLILSLLRRDPTERMALDAYLNSEWIVANQASAAVRPQVLERIESFHKKSSKLRNIALAKLYGRRMIRFLERKGLRSPTTSPFASPTPSPRPFSPIDTPLSTRSESATPPRRREFTFDSLADRMESKNNSRSALVFSPISPSSPARDGTSDTKQQTPIRPSVRASSRLNLKAAAVDASTKAGPAPAADESVETKPEASPPQSGGEATSDKSREYPYGRNSLAYFLEQQQQLNPQPEQDEKTPQQFRLSDSDKAAIKAKRKQDKKTVEGLFVKLASGTVVPSEETEEIDGAKEQTGDDDSDSLTENPEKVKEGRSKASMDMSNTVMSPTSLASTLTQSESKQTESKRPISDSGRGLPLAWYRPTGTSDAPLRDSDDGAAFVPLRMKVLKDEEDEAEDAIDSRVASESSRGVFDALRHAASTNTPARAATRHSFPQTQRSPSEDKESIDIGSPQQDRSPAKESDRSAMDLDSVSPKKPVADQSIQRALGDIQTAHSSEDEKEESKGYDLLGISMGVVAIAAFSYGAYVWWKRKVRR